MRRRRLDKAPGGNGPGEAQMIDTRMRRQRGARNATKSWHNVQRALREPGLPREFSKGQGSQAGFFRGLQNGGIACRERGADGTPYDLHRVVPGHNMPCHAMRLPQGVDRVAIKIRDRLTRQLVSCAAVEFHIPGQSDGVGTRLGQGLSDVQRLQPGELIDVIQDKLAQSRQNPSAFCRGGFTPRTRECVRGGRLGHINVVGRSGGDQRQF